LHSLKKREDIIISKSSRTPVYFILILVCLIWGGAFPAIKYLLSFLTPLELVKFRYILVAPYFLVILLTRDWRMLKEALGKSYIQIGLASFFGVIVYNLALAVGETRIPSGIASIIINLSPIFTLFLSVMFLKERFTPAKVGGMCASFVGLFILVHLSVSHTGDIAKFYLYVLITALAPLSWAIYTVTSKALTRRLDSSAVTALAMFLGTIPLFFFIRAKDFQVLGAMTISAWAVLLYLSYFSTALGYTVWVVALKKLPSTKVASFVYLIPVFSVIIGRIFLKEQITLPIVFGALLLLSGVYIVNRSKTEKKPE